MVVWQDEHIVDELEVLIGEVPIMADAEAIQVNRIDLKKHCAMAHAPAQAVALLDGFLSKHFPNQRVPLAGQNIGFDVAFMQRLYRLAQADFERRFSHRTIDTASIMGFLILAGVLPIRDASLNSGLAYFNIAFESGARHTALADARCTALLLTKLLEMVIALRLSARLEGKADLPRTLRE